MGHKTHTKGFKQNIVRKLLTPGGPTATALALELGLSNSTRSRWKQRVLHLADDRTRLELMAMTDTPTRPTDRPAAANTYDAKCRSFRLTSALPTRQDSP